jgi:hypothetical protein
MKGKALMTGAGLALAAGLTMGAAMKPALAVNDRPEGPQVVSDWAQASTGPFDDTSNAMLASYSGQVPDYVTGTDWKKAMAWPVSQTAYTTPLPRADDPEAHYTAPTEYAEAEASAPTEVSFPSRDGGRAYDAPAKPIAAVQIAPQPHFDADVPPEATGDTAPAES